MSRPVFWGALRYSDCIVKSVSWFQKLESGTEMVTPAGSVKFL